MKGGCHCGAVRFEVRAEIDRLLECNCSICRMKAYLHWIVPRDAFQVISGEETLACYRFGTRAARHYFCSTCGVAPYYVARSHPDKIDVNARCLDPADGLDLEAVERVAFDGQNWEQALAELERGERG